MLRKLDNSFEDTPLQSMVDALTELSEQTNTKDLSRAGEMLTAQAYVLDGIFSNMAMRAAMNANAGGYMEAADLYMKLALRAQTQCRATWETICAIQNPPLAKYVRQANIANGPQQVNNGPAPEVSRTGENENVQSKLLEAKDGKRLDTGTACTASGADQGMATVGTIDRPKDK